MPRYHDPAVVDGYDYAATTPQSDDRDPARSLSAGERIGRIQQALDEADGALGELAAQIDHVLRPEAEDVNKLAPLPERPTQSSLAHWLDGVWEHVEAHTQMINALRRRVDN